MGRKRIVEHHAASHGEQPHTDQWEQNALKAYTGGQHGDNFVGARHSTQSEQKRQQQRNREQNNQNLRNLRCVITNNEQETDVLIDKGRNVIAYVENEPDRDKSRDTVKIDLKEIANDISIEKLHQKFRISNFEFQI